MTGINFLATIITILQGPLGNEVEVNSLETEDDMPALFPPYLPGAPEAIEMERAPPPTTSDGEGTSPDNIPSLFPPFLPGAPEVIESGPLEMMVDDEEEINAAKIVAAGELAHNYVDPNLFENGQQITPWLLEFALELVSFSHQDQDYMPRFDRATYPTSSGLSSLVGNIPSNDDFSPIEDMPSLEESA